PRPTTSHAPNAIRTSSASTAVPNEKSKAPTEPKTSGPGRGPDTNRATSFQPSGIHANAPVRKAPTNQGMALVKDSPTATMPATYSGVETASPIQMNGVRNN